MTGSGQSIAQSLQLPLATVPLFGHSPTEKHKEESELTRNKGTRRIPIRKTRAAAITAAALRSTNVPSSGVRTDLSPSSYGKMTLILAYVLVMLSRAQSHSVLLDGDDWKVTNANRSISISARVPGGIYSDLHRAGIISEPYYRFNDMLQRWVCYDDWTWTSKFTVPVAVLASPNLNLVFHGIDTAANISLNGRKILTTDNMFLRYVVDVRGVLNEGDNNNLTVAIQSPIFYSLMKFSEFYQNNYTVYPTSHPASQNGEEHANFIRKMQSSFSWDWGPAFPSSGIWKSVELEYYDKILLRDVVIGTQENGDQWNVTLVIYVEGNQVPPQVSVKVDLETVGQIFNRNMPVEDGRVTISNIAVDERKVHRWWPNGYGDQVLYQLHVDVEGSSKNVRIGFRTIELVQNTMPGIIGLNFFFKVNGWPIYAKGSNLIPLDVLLERVTSAKIRSLMLSSKEANMNMLRIWGGGIYELDEVYEAADEYGILIWQDLMFACALYPSNKEFLDSVSEEVRQNIRRLQHHPSLALWAGNNENEMAIASFWWPQTMFHLTRYKDDYRTLYVHTIKPIVEETDPFRSYLVSSPTNGLQSEKEDYLSSSPGSNLYGDVHFYNYLMDSWKPNNFPTSRFVSEFGFQSFPSLRTWSQATDNLNDLVFPLSELANHRQHSSVVLVIPGNANIERKVYTKFNGPKVSLGPQEQFRIFCYLTQIHQAVSVKTAVEKFRRDRSQIDSSSGEGHNMGALYWQLNDIWQAPTWASIEYDGTWKMLHNYAKNFFSSLLITAHHEHSLWPYRNDISVWIISEFETPIPVNITLVLYSFDSFVPVRSLSLKKDLCSDCSMEAVSIKVDDLFNEPCTFVTCFLIVLMRDSKDELLSDNWLILEVPKKITSIVDADVRINKVLGPNRTDDGRYEFSVEVRGNAPAPFTWLEAGDVKGHFSDNGFFLYEPKKTVSFITVSSNVTAAQLAKKIFVVQYSHAVDLPKAEA
ncbi:beta-mannosidase-like isoform X1 [Varroa jacobsoni]|uniref:beta-mannosidase-like isoform X1 n=1 Tax=Varroa jacobsoni TaxID=62625 RepID=UPI000BF2AC3C|nr:beta-mannosidase-like isoform X1 [Varroa jacobsoni]